MFRKAVMTLEGVKSDSLFDCSLLFALFFLLIEPGLT